MVMRNEMIKQLDYLLKYYYLNDIKSQELINYIADNIDRVGSYWKISIRNKVRHFLINYYIQEFLVKDNPNLGNGLGKWHIQIVNDQERNIYCGQHMVWNASFHRDLTVRDLVESDDNSYTLYSICTKCVKGYLRKDRKISKNN